MKEAASARRAGPSGALEGLDPGQYLVCSAGGVSACVLRRADGRFRTGPLPAGRACFLVAVPGLRGTLSALTSRVWSVDVVGGETVALDLEQGARR